MHDYDKKQIGFRLNQLRKYKGWSLAYVSKRCGVSAQSICKLESGNGNLTVPMLMKFCQLYDVTADYIMLGKGEIKNKTFADIISKFTPAQIKALDNALLNYQSICGK